MRFEQQTLDKVIAARSRVSQAHEASNVGALGAAEGAFLIASGAGIWLVTDLL